MPDFENYIQQNKEHFDSKEVDPNIWKNIEQKIKPKARKWQKIVWLVACLSLIFSGVLAYMIKEKKIVLKESGPRLLAETPANKAYEKTLWLKSQQIQSTPVSNEYKNQLQLLLDQVHYLDKLYASTFEYLQNASHTDDMAKSQLEYYQAKSELLDKVLFEIEKINNNEKEFNINSEKSTLVY